MKDYLVKAYAFDGFVRIYGAKTTDLVEEARLKHDTWPAATAALGRVLTASVIMGAMYKGDMELSIRIDGNGPLGGVVATTNALGEVRGYVGNPHVHMSTNANKLAVGAVVGKDGFIHVTKNLKVRDIYTSSAALQTGEIGDDFAYYFASSEQVPSSVGLGVLVNDDNSVKASGGFILQLLPGAQTFPGLIEEIEKNINQLRPISDLIHDGFTPEMIINEITKGKHEFVEYLDLKYACDCTRDRFARGLTSLGKDELQSMINDNKTIETVCHFCQKKYYFTVADLLGFRNETIDFPTNKK
ncbi:MAG: Hsp33 family molecular chaperone HslO [Candidatus Izemoplasmatales bacterium]|nr:Hsp33 family molecular chaperone HslO [Candidatus Izemoplasmatales bacterium]